jgi:peptidoglycan hydrolase-like protein with peptidoglycan-binding domain
MGQARRRLRSLAIGGTATLTLLVAAAGATYGLVGLSQATETALRTRAVPSPVNAEDSAAPTPIADPKPVRKTAPAATFEPIPYVLEPGDRGRKVRELQARLAQLAWFVPPMTGVYDEETVKGVRGFQRKRGFEGTGKVDDRTWRRVVKMSRQPTGDEMFNRAGPALYGPGDRGAEVRKIQARLRQIAWYFGDVTGVYSAHTREAVYGFQGKRHIPQTGKVDQRTLDLLHGMTVEPSAAELANKPPDPAEGASLDPRCTTGLALCIDKSSQSLRWVVNGDVRMTVDVRFGSAELPTREGQFSVYRKSRDHVSSLYHTSMPYAMFFSGGQAVHYSPDFAANGYNGASHGCVNVRDYDAVSWLFDEVPIGTKVIVYWS